MWNENAGDLPLHFGASGLSAAVGLLELRAIARVAPCKRQAWVPRSSKCWEGWRLESRQIREIDPLKRGFSGTLTRAGGALSGPLPLALRLLSMAGGKHSSESLRKWAAVSAVAGSLLTRIAWIYAGHVSARDWREPLEVEEAPPRSDPD